MECSKNLYYFVSAEIEMNLLYELLQIMIYMCDLPEIQRILVYFEAPKL